MKMVKLHTGPKSNTTALIFNPLSVVYGKQAIGDDYQSIIMAGGTAFPVNESVEEIANLIEDALKSDFIVDWNARIHEPRIMPCRTAEANREEKE